MNYGYMPISKMRKQQLIKVNSLSMDIPCLSYEYTTFKPISTQFQKYHSSPQHFASLGPSNISLIWTFTEILHRQIQVRNRTEFAFLFQQERDPIRVYQGLYKSDTEHPSHDWQISSSVCVFVIFKKKLMKK